MPGIERRTFADPDETIEYGEHGQAGGIVSGEGVVWRSTLLPGWSWDEDIKPYAGLDSCPLHHHEYVVSGRIRYQMDDGTELVASAGDYLDIGPGHRATVEGDEPCVLVDW